MVKAHSQIKLAPLDPQAASSTALQELLSKPLPESTKSKHATKIDLLLGKSNSNLIINLLQRDKNMAAKQVQSSPRSNEREHTMVLDNANS